MRTIVSLLSLLLIATAAIAQKSVPLPPKPADSGPSLEVTMKFLQEELNEQGKVSIIHTGHDTLKNENGGPWKYVWEMSQVSAEPAACRLSWRVHFEWPNPAAVDEYNLELSLRDVTKIEVISMRDEFNRESVKDGHPERISQTDPPAFFLVAYMANGKSVHGRVHKGRPDNKSSDEEATYALWKFPFGGEELANRVAKAMLHGVELCGGGENEPF
jgi:hypothetical protein